MIKSLILTFVFASVTFAGAFAQNDTRVLQTEKSRQEQDIEQTNKLKARAGSVRVANGASSRERAEHATVTKARPGSVRATSGATSQQRVEQATTTKARPGSVRASTSTSSRQSAGQAPTSKARPGSARTSTSASSQQRSEQAVRANDGTLRVPTASRQAGSNPRQQSVEKGNNGNHKGHYKMHKGKGKAKGHYNNKKGRGHSKHDSDRQSSHSRNSAKSLNKSEKD